MEFGGLGAIAEDLLALFPERAGKVAEACNPLTPSEEYLRYLREDSPEPAVSGARSIAYGLERFCIDPNLDLEGMALRPVLALLWEYEERRNELAAASRVVTSTGRQVCELLTHAFTTRRMVIIEGASGSGKSTEAEAWCRANFGEVRFVTLPGITNRTILFQKIGAVLGLSVCQQSSAKLQARIEAHLARTGIMLVIDEAHFLWPQHKRTHSAPELIDWINTALVNNGVPVALICTPQFAKLKAHVEKQVGWTSDQLIHRTARYCKLPSEPTSEDVAAVAAWLLKHRYSEAEERWQFDASVSPNDLAIRLLRTYAGKDPLPLAAARNLIENARSEARSQNSRAVTLGTLRAALAIQKASDSALRAAFAYSAPTRSYPLARTDRMVTEGDEPAEQMSNFLPHPRATSLAMNPAPKLSNVVQ